MINIKEVKNTLRKQLQTIRNHGIVADGDVIYIDDDGTVGINIFFKGDTYIIELCKDGIILYNACGEALSARPVSGWNTIFLAHYIDEVLSDIINVYILTH